MRREADDWFNKLYLENVDRLNRMAVRLLGNESIGQELVQEVFLLMFCKYERLKEHPNVPGWLSTTLKNRVMDKRGSASFRRELPLETAGELGREDHYEDPLISMLPPGLTEKEQEILVLVYEKQMAYDEISNHLNISVLNCRTRLYRAKNHYRDLVQEEEPPW